MTEAEYYKQQDEQAVKEEFIAKRTDSMFDEVKAGTFNPYRLIELQVTHFENNGEVDNLFRDLLKIDESDAPMIIAMKATSDKCLFLQNFYRCEHVQAQMTEWAEYDLTQEAEDNYNERACEARDCD